jgi:hypothetical protein
MINPRPYNPAIWNSSSASDGRAARPPEPGQLASQSKQLHAALFSCNATVSALIYEKEDVSDWPYDAYLLSNSSTYMIHAILWQGARETAVASERLRNNIRFWATISNKQVPARNNRGTVWNGGFYSVRAKGL